MIDLPIRYIDPVYRPPSEAESLILPITNGCSWNRCLFCEMYTDPQKRFRALPEDDVLDTIRRCGEQFGPRVRKVFLADGDAMVLSTRRLLAVLAAIRDHLPRVTRVSSYCLPRNLRAKSDAEMAELADAGLKLAYVGAESGDSEVLARVHKGEDHASTLEALEKLGRAGLRRSVMILNGLGGERYSVQHAENSARLANAAQPEYLSTLVLGFRKGETRFRGAFPDWTPLSAHGLFKEMGLFLSALELRRTIFRSDHASNWLVLKGTLGADKERLLAQVGEAIERPAEAKLRPEWARGF